MSTRLGLMMATMQPPPAMEEEFQDWYDTEHFPERQNCEGFVTARRFVCLEGFPRYLALYDLSHVSVMDGPAYAAIARNRYSQWTRRIIPRMAGHYRAEGEQIWPGTARMGDNGQATRVVLWRFGGVPAASADAVVAGVRACAKAQPHVLQARVFQARGSEPTDFIATFEMAGATAVPVADPAVLGGLLGHLNMVNVYTPYWR